MLGLLGAHQAHQVDWACITRRNHMCGRCDTKVAQLAVPFWRDPICRPRRRQYRTHTKRAHVSRLQRAAHIIGNLVHRRAARICGRDDRYEGPIVVNLHVAQDAQLGNRDDGNLWIGDGIQRGARTSKPCGGVSGDDRFGYHDAHGN